MKFKSLSLRLLLAAGLSTVMAIVATGFVISYQFQKYFEHRLTTELRTELTQLTAALDIRSDGTADMKPLSDKRFEQPFSGRYWQVGFGSDTVLLSRSLWDQPLAMTITSVFGQQEQTKVIAPFGAELLALSWRVTAEGFSDPAGITLTVATDLSEVSLAASQFRYNIAFWLALLGVALILAAWLQVRVGLRPLEKVRTHLEKVSHRADSRLPKDYPTEVLPLVETINGLLEQQATSLADARRQASNLAHGLKTPLTILTTLAAEARVTGDSAQADQVEEQIASMRSFVERELARSRVSLANQSTSDVRTVAEKMLSAITKLPDADRLEWTLDIPDDIKAPFDEHDLSELLGNLLDNARKHAVEKVSVRARKTSGKKVILLVEDDGAGVAQESIEHILRPGVKESSTSQGQGLGLAIVQDLLTHHNCKFQLENLKDGGFRAAATWSLDQLEGHKKNECPG
ncbi:MAG: HAMP domain-containing histidine kinase [Rhodobacteraceae bacterium]|nr:HAMP domain-containing histidine kinase [Paracoccaceae bacterium]